MAFNENPLSTYSEPYIQSETILEESKQVQQNEMPDQDGDKTITPIKLLRYLRSIKEFELYYYLFNQVEVGNIAYNKLEISRENSDKILNNKLAEALFAWTGAKWNVIIVDGLAGGNLKDAMKEKFMLSEEWRILKENFLDSILTDIILV